MTRSGLIVSVLFLLWSCLNVGALECGFECYNNSTCAESDADFSDHPTKVNGDPLDIHVETNRDGMHCKCPPGFTGLRCARTYLSCLNDESHKCYHGGQCIEGLEDIYGNSQYFCDCSTAVENGVTYAGKYCELPAINVCDSAGEKFCVNGMECKPDWHKTPLHPCKCGSEYTGPHCEFKKGTVPECNMTCHNGGACRLGIQNLQLARLEYQDFWQSQVNAMHCECPEGFFGTQCDIKAEVCGDKHCFNGAKCVPGKLGKMHCDCSYANTPMASYAGRWCQYQSSTFCEKAQDADGHTFCVNGGTCKAGGSHLGCNCPPEFHGPLCQLRKGKEQAEECKLTCANGGKCRKGAKDYKLLGSLSGLHMSDITNKTHDENFEHCACPDGFTGLTCETKVETCGAGEHVCFHGSRCVKSAGEHFCRCDAAFTAFSKTAGKYCQHKSTSICTANGQPGLGKDEMAFCVNGGVCLGFADGNG